MNQPKFWGSVCVAAIVCGDSLYAQVLSGPAANPKYAFSTALPTDVAVPSSLETRIGTLKFDGGCPDEDSTRGLYDNLDFQRAVQAYLLGLPPNVPVKRFWSVIVYSSQTRSIVQTDRQSPQLGADDPRRIVVHHPAPLRPPRTLVQQEFAAG